MSFIVKFIYHIILMMIIVFPSTIFANNTTRIPVLCYHNFSPTTPGSMNMRPEKFEEHIKWLKENGFTIIPLQEAVEYLQGTRSSLPPKSVVISADDGWQSVYTYMLPLVKKYQIPVTLFIYPQTISEGKHAMTWDELKELQDTKLFDIQGHTYSHPNFKHAKKEMTPAHYEKFVNVELANSKKILEEKMHKPITLLAWPFGIYDAYLEDAAKKAGYAMAFSIDYRTATRNDRPMAQPRFMMIEAQSMKTFVGIVNEATKSTKSALDTK